MQSNSRVNVVVSGASSMVAGYLVPMLHGGGYRVTGLSRQAMPSSAQLDWLQVDFDDLARGSLPDLAADALIHLAPLPAIVQLLPLLPAAGVKRIIAVGTTSSITKSESGSPADRELVFQMQQAEHDLSEFANREKIDWTLIRPTMVYDGYRDKNVALIKRFVRRFGFAPIVSPASGMRQPLHARDLAQLLFDALKHGGSGNIYNVGGGEELKYRDMLDRIFNELGKPTRLLPLPRLAVGAGLNAMSMVPGYRHVNAAMADRMNQDMVFDNSEARSALGFNPGRFEPGG